MKVSLPGKVVGNSEVVFLSSACSVVLVCISVGVAINVMDVVDSKIVETSAATINVIAVS